MKKGLWHGNIQDGDSIDVVAAEVENLENDELSVEEAGFLQGYEEDLSDLYEIYEEA